MWRENPPRVFSIRWVIGKFAPSTLGPITWTILLSVEALFKKNFQFCPSTIIAGGPRSSWAVSSARPSTPSIHLVKYQKTKEIFEVM
jgi:hypothetical protein